MERKKRQSNAEQRARVFKNKSAARFAGADFPGGDGGAGKGKGKAPGSRTRSTGGGSGGARGGSGGAGAGGGADGVTKRIPRKRKARPQPTHDFVDAKRGLRLQKVLAAAGVASRRNCELLIEQGSVTVNGHVVRTLPAWVHPEKDHIEVDGRPIARNRRATGSVGKAGHVYVALHKPRDVFATTSDEFGRETVTDLVQIPALNPGDPPPRLYPVGRLDADATGLMLLTNDGELAHRLTHPSFEVTKEYEVSVRGRLDKDDVNRLIDGIKNAHRPGDRRKPAKKTAGAAKGPAGAAAQAVKSDPGNGGNSGGTTGEVQILGHQRDDEHGERTTLLIKLNEGPDREIKWVLKRLGFNLRRLKRIAIGPVKLKGIAIRNWRMLTPIEVNKLRREVGLGNTK